MYHRQRLRSRLCSVSVLTSPLCIKLIKTETGWTLGLHLANRGPSSRNKMVKGLEAVCHCGFRDSRQKWPVAAEASHRWNTASQAG